MNEYFIFFNIELKKNRQHKIINMRWLHSCHTGFTYYTSSQCEYKFFFKQWLVQCKTLTSTTTIIAEKKQNHLDFTPLQTLDVVDIPIEKNHLKMRKLEIFHIFFFLLNFHFCGERTRNDSNWKKKKQFFNFEKFVIHLSKNRVEKKRKVSFEP